MSDHLEEDADVKGPFKQAGGPGVDMGWYLRKPGVLAALGGLAFLAGIGGTGLLLLVFLWPSGNVPVYYFVMRPGFVWFGMVMPLVLAGAWSVRWRWVGVGLALWLVGLGMCDDVYRVFRPAGGAAQGRFAVAHEAHWAGAAQGTPRSEMPTRVPVRILTWNVHSGTMDADALTAEIAALQPDVVLFQEFAWKGGDNQMKDAISARADMANYVLKPGSHFGSLSRFPVRDVRSDFLAPYTHAVCEVEIAPDRWVRLINVHFPPPEIKTQLLRGWTWSGLAKAVGWTRKTVDGLQSAMASHDGPMIVAGDFNLTRYYPDLKAAMSAGGMTECFSDGGFGWGKTAPAKLPAMRVDMVYVPRDAQVMYCSAIPTRHSDHFGMLAEVLLPLPEPTPAETGSPSRLK